MRVLVSAASQHGSTNEIAKAIGEQLTSRGLDVTVAAPAEVGSLTAFDAVVIGSAVYTGRWQTSAVDLAERVGRELADRPVWLFSSGPVGNPTRKIVQQMGADPVDLPKLMTATGAREHRMFAGRLDRRRLRGLQRLSLWLFRGLDGDFRDWSAIQNWADSIADHLAALKPTTKAG
jgi:menaquinone-dependent protoporphyrinogen oxidase